MKTKQKSLTLRDMTVLRDVCRRRVDDLEKKINQCAGSLYPNIMSSQAEEIASLFFKLTGDTLYEEDNANDS